MRSDDGQEIILSGTSCGRRKVSTGDCRNLRGISAQLGEDREAIAQQLDRLRAVEKLGVAVVVFHDLAEIDELIQQGILGDGVELYLPSWEMGGGWLRSTTLSEEYRYSGVCDRD